jgi:hypothetical protein
MIVYKHKVDWDTGSPPSQKIGTQPESMFTSSGPQQGSFAPKKEAANQVHRTARVYDGPWRTTHTHTYLTRLEQSAVTHHVYTCSCAVCGAVRSQGYVSAQVAPAFAQSLGYVWESAAWWLSDCLYRWQMGASYSTMVS